MHNKCLKKGLIRPLRLIGQGGACERCTRLRSEPALTGKRGAMQPLAYFAVRRCVQYQDSFKGIIGNIGALYSF